MRPFMGLYEAKSQLQPCAMKLGSVQRFALRTGRASSRMSERAEGEETRV